MNIAFRRKDISCEGGAESRAPLALRHALILCAASTLAAIAGAYVALTLYPLRPAAWLTEYFFRTQDSFWLIATAALLVACTFLRFPTVFSAALPRVPTRLVAFGLAALAFLCGAIGSSLVFDGLHLSRDEILAEFDAVVLRTGQLIAPVEPEWRPFSQALAPRFMLPIADQMGFASQYLPGNALLRAFVGLWADSSLTSPILLAIAVLAAYSVARRLWPDRRDVAIIAPLLIATSPQALVTAMTSYAMTAHLALNLLWLALFLRNDKAGHAGAILIGALACGLHQVVFHPLFVAPFILRLWWEKRRVLALVYSVSYALICLFWMRYFQIALELQGMASDSARGAGLLDFISRAVEQILTGERNGFAIMLMNILRFVSWQNPLLLPLALLAYGQIRQGSGIARELAAGVALTLYAMTIVMTYQGHGWGYRYLHGLIGNLALLAAYGWISVTAQASAVQTAACRSTVAVSSLFAALLLFPAHAKQAHDFAAPYARASAAIARAPTDVVILDESDMIFSEDLVRNDPFLRDRPIVLELTPIEENDLVGLCQKHSVSLFDASQGRRYGIRPDPGRQGVAEEDLRAKLQAAEERRVKLRAAMARASCGAPLSITP
ncbi:hypothetical protein OGR47_14955 [Methylocystis sp. MJC1]|jgi:hypothetical protein|uniref:hypothetical protein n=1 Tax=Methylocystis sp. MJC1 TaxID=2654282 RepID=UPI0013EC278C|nr:hypothetical protein [Methylocystis sp. MJC1]KAF2990467.1 hypothetical protein MJC1_02567 [Methylocystis sp. MJC1]MBU6528262.1 hypothetical protein [Methylocystis sp. MJC1]UZX11169.1 hypothetical protein OGR47_14955 [Methylocystis sp. MJC1]